VCGPRPGRSLEARTEHPGARALTESSGGVIGIDLGTTNSALAWAGTRGAVRTFDVPQLVAAGEIGRPPTLPSFLYVTDDAQRAAGAVSLPWNAAPEIVCGAFARDEGALVPARLVASAKSWLSNPHVDRTAPLLPWGTDAARRLSPVEASALVLRHLRDAWNHEQGREGESGRLERQSIVLTVPASFDEEARELTVQAATDAGLDRVTLLEEPLAALYAWMAAHRRELGSVFGSGALVLVCDVGGGTTDFSLIRAHVADGDLTFERIAIGEHLLLGGDNLDLALAALVEQKLSGSGRLTLTQRQTLRRKCSAAKEQLLSDTGIDRVAITLLGAGRGVVGGGMTADLTRAEVESALRDGFLPVTAAGDLPARDRRAGLRELGLPYETEPAITKHLAAFLTRAAKTADARGMARPDVVLFNGGFFTPPIARTRVLDALDGWFGARPGMLEHQRPDAAVALGAAFYGRLRRDPALGRRLLIRAGSARAYYIGVDAAEQGRAAVCVLPRGTEEGSRYTLDRAFTVISNQPAAFTLYSSIDRSDPLNAVVQFAGDDEIQRHAPLVTALRYGKRSRRVPIAVGLTSAFTETGTLELWCESKASEHRWRLAFNLRAVEADPLDEAMPAGEAPEVIVDDEAIARAEDIIRSVFTQTGEIRMAPEEVIGQLENALGHGKLAWPLASIRKLADVLLQVEPGRGRAAAYEARWLNLIGFCIRPGFGSALDSWRVSELRKVYAAGLIFPKETQNQVEWIVLWQRIGAGFTAGQQRELAQRMSGQLGLGQRKPSRLNPQIERESWRLLASLERLDAAQRAKLGDELVERVRKDPRNASWLWSLGRLGARHPLYGPLNSVVGPGLAEQWIDRLLALKQLTADVADAVAQIGARTGDHARDIADAVAERAASRLDDAGYENAATRLRAIVTTSQTEAGRVFGESLPEGLRLHDNSQPPTPNSQGESLGRPGGKSGGTAA
jgi:molecular chaperone DnaK (HSP70)